MIFNCIDAAECSLTAEEQRARRSRREKLCVASALSAPLRWKSLAKKSPVFTRSGWFLGLAIKPLLSEDAVATDFYEKGSLISHV
jgi:hypothetical protein